MPGHEPTALHRVLGIIAFGVLITMPILDGFVWFEASSQMMAVLAVVFLVLIGFGAVVETWVKHQ